MKYKYDFGFTLDPKHPEHDFVKTQLIGVLIESYFGQEVSAGSFVIYTENQNVSEDIYNGVKGKLSGQFALKHFSPKEIDDLLNCIKTISIHNYSHKSDISFTHTNCKK